MNISTYTSRDLIIILDHNSVDQSKTLWLCKISVSAMQQPWSQANLGADYYQSGAYSSHYARAYMQSLGGQQGSHPAPQASTSTSFYEPPFNSSTSNGNHQQRPTFDARPPSWHQHGSHRCTYPNCRFAGSPKTLEIHRMDRHLIYPPGWDKQRKKNDWDADPSLKGYAHYVMTFTRSLTIV